MDAAIESIYMDLLVEIGRAGISTGINLVWANKKNRFMLIREGDYRSYEIGLPDSRGVIKYELIGLYDGKGDYPRFVQIHGDIYAFIQQETSKEYGCRPELERIAQTG